MRLVLLVVTLAGCTAGIGDTTTYNGYQMADFFPFDGAARSWTFSSDDETVPYKVVGNMNPHAQTIPGSTDREAYEIDFTMECIGDDDPSCKGPYRIQSWKWSADSTYGVFVYSYDTDAGTVQFDPPVQIFERDGKVGDADIVTEETDGNVFTSTLVAFEACPVKWTSDWDNCVHFKLEDSNGESDIAGDYWAVASYNIVAMQLRDDTDKWELLSADYQQED